MRLENRKALAYVLRARATHSVKIMPKESLKDKLDGNELDLSLSNLEVVPVKELASIPKATQLDLSCNLLTSLPDSFCSLVHLVKIDLSKNRLTELPRDFGQLENLQHLDLLGNQLVSLPESFHRLQKLKWLDLKDNPLEPQLKKNAGDCLDEKQCRICAQRILLFMKDLSEELEKKRQKKLQQQKDKEAEKKAREEALARKKREEKKAEKEKRKREAEAKRVEQRPTGPTEEKVKRNDSTPDGVSKRSAKDARPGSSSCCTVLLSIFVLLVALVVGIVFHCRSNLQDQLCLQYYKPMEGQVLEAADVTWQYAEFLYKTTDKQSAEWYQVAATKSVEGYELLSASAKSAFKSVMEFFTINDETSS